MALPPAQDPISPPPRTVAETDEIWPVLAELGPGASISRYIVLERIGIGGMGVVYAAYDPDLDRKVAIKLLQVEDEGDSRGSRGRARLVREAQALAQLTHPNVVTVHDVGTWQSRVFVAMEFVRGRTLSRWIADTSPSLRDVIDMFVQAGQGLAAAHARGLVHRDFKPDNVIVGDDGRARVLDFGLARTIAKPGEPSREEPDLDRAESGASPRSDVRLTRTGTLAGTPAYMAPEQFQGLPGDARADQFSFCIALWEALYGQRPFAGNDRFALAVAVVGGHRRPVPVDSRVPASLRRLLERGLATDPADRFTSIDELLEQLRVRPSRLPWFGVAALGVVAIGTFVATRESSSSPCERADQHLAAVWEDSHRVALREGFTASGSPIGADTGARVVASLDDYAARWTAGWREVCVATHERHERSADLFDRAMACLQQRRDALAATVSRLERADADAIVHAVDAVAALPVIERCVDPDTLLASVPPPDDDVADAVAALRSELADAEVLGRLGRYADGLRAADDQRRRATALGYRPLVAEIDAVAGDLARMAGQSEEGRRRLVDAAIEALALGHDAVLARATTKLASEVGIGQSRYVEGLLWARQAAAAVERIGAGGPEDADLAVTMCMLLADKGEFVMALPQCLRAVELAHGLWGEDDIRSAGAWQALGIAYFSAGRYADAEHEFMRVHEAFTRDKGELHPDIVQIRNSLAATCHALRGAGECVDAFAEVVAAALRVHGPEHPDVAGFANNHAIILHELGRDDEAEAQARLALEIRRKHFGEEHPGVGASLGVLGDIALVRGDLPAARAALDAALANLRRTRGPRHPDVVQGLRQAGEVRIAQGEHDDGLALLREALTLATELGRPKAELDELRSALAKHEQRG